MKLLNKLICFGLLGCVLIITPAWGQDTALQLLIQGKKAFWEAKFDQANTSLKKIIGIQDAKTEYLYEAYLYLGFVLTRQNASGLEVNAAFEQAIKLDPQRKLDELIIPPDLAERFNRVRDKLVGCLYIDSTPSDAEFVVVYEDSVLYNKFTPVLICELTKKNYQILITEEDFEEQYLPMHLTPGKVDTLFVTLKPSLVEKKKGKKLWAWVTRGGIVAAASLIIYKTVLSGKENVDNLPGPPTRPSQN